MPRADHESGQTTYSEDDYWTPTYRSRSLLYSDPSDHYTQAVEDPGTGASAPPKTFAAMARRFHLTGKEGDMEQSSQSPASAGIVRLQPKSREGSSSWRPTGISGLDERNDSGHENGNASSADEHAIRQAPLRRSAPSSVLTTSPHKPPNKTYTGIKFGELRIDRANSSKPIFTCHGSGQDGDQADPRTNSNERAELFGDLPDPIRLHEQLGQFDGQVFFIGHPNRDVSAHQWSSTSFQWENIGRFSHSRGRIEGSLASDQVTGYEGSRNSLLYFKLAAENREKLVVEDGRPAEASDTVRIISADIPRSAAAVKISKGVAEENSDLSRGQAPSIQPYQGAAKTTSVPSYDTIQNMHLDDPFVAKTNPLQHNFPSQANVTDAKGSLDLRYEFPVKANTPTPQEDAESRSNERGSSIPAHGTRSYMRLTQRALPEIKFGEEAASGPHIAVGPSGIFHGLPKPFSPEIVNGQRKFSGLGAAFGEHTKHPDAAMQGRTAIPRFETVQPTARSLFPTTGLTIANPHRGVSRLDPAAPSHTTASVPLRAVGSDAIATDLAPAAALQFSDPDGLRQAQGYEVANGLNKQPPTAQTFKGLFFTESMPTANDPSLSLSIHVSEAEKLQNWFRDGHHPDRQREYARTLISAAALGKKRHPGAIGEAAGVGHDSETKNTFPFVRLYENLSEYIEEHRNDSGGSYFTRAWTVASPQLRDLGPNGNNSFFSDAGRVAVEARPHTSVWYQQDRTQRLNVFPTPSSIMERLSSHGTVGDGGVGLGKKGARVGIVGIR
jgi:hypothetical protein